MANELAARLCEGVGSGGGHKDKAGGFISGDKLAETGLSPAAFLEERFKQYYGEYDLVYSENYEPDLGAMEQYRKLKIPIGFARSSDVFPVDTDIVVRTIEGDTFITADPDIYIMVGICQEIWPIRREKFEASYDELDGPYAPDETFRDETGYTPTVKDKKLGEAVSLEPFIRPCVPTGDSLIYAKKLDRRTKVFTAWNREGYMFGDAGDFLAVRDDDSRDVYVIEKNIFSRTYEKVEGD